MGRHYRRSPLQEAIFECRFTQDTPWDPTIPGLFYERVRDRYPIKETRMVVKAQHSLKEGRLHQSQQWLEYAVFKQSEGPVLAQVGPRIIAVNSVAPCPSWEVFRPHMDTVLAIIASICDLRGVQRAGLRYINHIQVPGPDVDLQTYFQFRPELGALPDSVQSCADFTLACVLLVDGAWGHDLCKVELGKVAEDCEGAALMSLDLDYFTKQPPKVPFDDLLTWADKAQDVIDRVFEGTITNETRRLFGEVK